MTKMNLIKYIQKDLRKIEKEREALKPSVRNAELRNYLIARQATLKEILGLITSK